MTDNSLVFIDKETSFAECVIPGLEDKLHRVRPLPAYSQRSTKKKNKDSCSITWSALGCCDFKVGSDPESAFILMELSSFWTFNTSFLGTVDGLLRTES